VELTSTCWMSVGNYRSCAPPGPRPSVDPALINGYIYACFTSDVVMRIAECMTAKGRAKLGTAWTVHPGEVWFLFGYQMHMVVNPSPAPKEDCWREDPIPGTVVMPQDSGKYDLSYPHRRKLRDFFALPMHPNNPHNPDPFRPICVFDEA